jgi:anti-anti-sigma regulatory factor
MFSQAIATLFHTNHFPDVVLIGFYPQSLDETTAPKLAENLLDVVQESEARKLYLNFNNVRYVSHGIWRELIDLNVYLQERGWRIYLLNLTSSLSHELRSEEEPDMAATREAILV